MQRSVRELDLELVEAELPARRTAKARLRVGLGRPISRTLLPAVVVLCAVMCTEPRHLSKKVAVTRWPTALPPCLALYITHTHTSLHLHTRPIVSLNSHLLSLKTKYTPHIHTHTQ